MKISKSLVIVALCLCSTPVLHARNEKNEPAKHITNQPQQPATVPSPTPEFKPQPGSTKPKEDPTPANNPSLKMESEEKSKPAEQPKVNLQISNPDADKKKLTQEQEDILNGKKQSPKAQAPAIPNTSRPDAMMPPLPKAAMQQ